MALQTLEPVRDGDEWLKLKDLYVKDEDMLALGGRILNGELPMENTADENARLMELALHHVVEDGKLWRIDKGKGRRLECIPRERGKGLLTEIHSRGGHWGRDIILGEARKKYEWSGMWKDASEVVAECLRCRQFGPRLINFLLQPIYKT